MKTNFYLTMARVLTLGIVVLIIGSIASGQIPVLNNISPSTVEVGNDGLTMILNGENFLTTSIVRFNGSDLITTFVSESELEASLTKSKLSLIGAFEVVVANPSPNGGVSAAKQFTVTGTSQQITSISPTTMVFGFSDLILQVYGEGFTSNTVVRFNGSDRPTTFNNSTHLTAKLNSGDLLEAGEFGISAYSFDAGGGVTNSVILSIIYPEPTLNGISPSAIMAGSPTTTFIIEGSNFTPASKVQFDDFMLMTTFISSTLLSVEVSSNYLKLIGAVQIYVHTPIPGGGLSNFVVLDIYDTTPQIGKISPAKLKLGSAGLMMKIMGQGFNYTSVVKYDGMSRTTTVVDSKTIFVNILADDVKKVGKYRITVADQASGNVESNEMILTVYSTKSTRENDSDIRAANSMEPDDFFLAQNYPNPFNPSTMINFILRNMSTVTIDVYNSLGQRVATLLDGKELSAGEQTFQFDAANLASGEYFYHIIVNENDGDNFSSIKKMILIK